jgi:glycolate oxidase FAD binding subunit
VIGERALEALRGAAGGSAVLEHDPICLDGVKIGFTLAPADVDRLAATLACCREHGVGLLVRGGGNRIGVGNRPDESAAAWLSTAALSSECRVEADEGVAWVSAATPVAELARAAREAGWLSPLEPSGPTSTVGGALATAIAGPRALGLGRARDVALGLEVALASGERTRCGARVVKNVSGYDLVKLYLGSFGTLGVITGGWLRLRPLPETVRTFLAQRIDAPEAVAQEVARRPSARAVAWVGSALGERVGARPGTACMLAEFAGDAAVVDEAEAFLRERAEVVPAPEGAVESLRDLVRDSDLGSLVFRVAAPPSAFADLRARLRDAGARTITHPGLGQLIAGFPLQREDEAAADEACRAVGSALAGLDGHAVLERAPSWAKEGRDVFDARTETLPLMRALKREFDPDRILNPGRFVGGL